MAWSTSRTLYSVLAGDFALILGSGGAPNVALTEARGVAIRTDATTRDALVYLTIDNGTTWTEYATLPDLQLGATSDVTVVTGVATLTAGVHTVRGEAAGADNVDTISGLIATEIAILLTGAEAITYRDAATGGGNIATDGNASLVTATGDMVMAILSGTVVRIVPLVITAGLPVGLSALARGRIIRGSSAGLAEALSLVAADTIAIGDGTDVVGLVLPTTGLVVKTAAGAVSGRSIAVGTSSLTIANGDGVAGNPTLDTAQDIRTTATPTFADVKVTPDAAANGTGVVATSEQLQVRTLLLTLSNTPVVMADAAGVIGYGSLKIVDMPAGAIQFLGAVTDIDLTKSEAAELGLISTWDGDVSLGTAAAAGDADLTSTEADIIPKTATPQAVAGATTANAQSTITQAGYVVDGTSTAVDVYLNFLVDDADHDITAVPVNIICNGTIKITYVNLGDY